jgi:heme exporter protein B
VSFLGACLTIAWKDLRAEFRSGETLAAMGVFSLVVVTIFGFTLGAGEMAIGEAYPALAWIGFSFAGLLGLSRSFTAERQDGALTGLLLAPVDRSAIFYGKMAANLALLLLIETLSLPLYALLLGAPAPARPGALAAALFVGTLGFAAAGTFLAALAGGTRAGELLLPVLFFPVAIPIIVTAVALTGAAVTGDLAGTGGWWRLALAFDLVFLAAPGLLFEYLLEA